jgi:hypothetical protein
MTEPDERRIAELAKKPPRVLQTGTSAQALKEALKEACRVLEAEALMSRQELDGEALDD